MPTLTPESAGRPPGIRTIFIDFGNVIAFFDHHRATARLIPFTDMPEAELFRTLYGGQLEEDYEHGRITTEEYVRDAIRAGRLTCTPDEFVSAFQAIFTPNPEILDLIPRLKPRYRLVLASNTTDAHYRKYCDQFSSAMAHFDARCPSHHVGHRKPAAAYYEYCQQFADAPPHQCLFIDDILGNVESSTVSVGWKGIVYRPRDKFPDKLRAFGIELNG
jgi:putative hydrolase of the HAD superfamily